MFPLRESRVSFKEPVDSRTFQGRILNAETGEVATGVDGSPALFTRATITASEALDVVGTYPALGPGKYMLDFSVKTVAGKAVKGSVTFTQLEPFISPGGGNHRHGDVRLPFEEQFTTLARGLIIMTFGLLFRRKAKGLLIPAALGLAGAIHLTAVAIPASDTILTTAELLGRIDGWAAAGVLVAAVAAAMARKTSERVVAVFFASAASLATTYIPNMSTAIPVSILLISTMAAAGAWIASAFGWRKSGSVTWLLLGAHTAVAPALASWVASSTLRSDRVLEAGLRGNLLSAAIILATSTISVILVRLLPANKLINTLVRGLTLIVVVCAAIATAAPALL
jgi:hypothetical protein